MMLMKDLKSIDYKILFELMKDSKRSDRQLARVLHVSQPTITRRRTMLEKELIDGYTAIPKWEKLGYELFVFTFVNTEIVYEPKEKSEAATKKVREWMMRHPNVIVAGKGSGMGSNGFFLSIHKNYSDYEKFISEHDNALGEFTRETRHFIVSIEGLNMIKPFHLKYLAETK
jgi:DNA-binding Lrp family transcriptional regulator